MRVTLTGLLALGAAAVLTVPLQASAALPLNRGDETALVPAVYLDPMGDDHSGAAPDIHEMTMDNDARDLIVTVSLPNRPQGPGAGVQESVSIHLNTDGSTTTGASWVGGAEYAIGFGTSWDGAFSVGMRRWSDAPSNGPNYVPTPHSSLRGSWSYPRASIRVARAEIGGPSGLITFVVESEQRLPLANIAQDLAPDRGLPSYSYAIEPVAPPPPDLGPPRTRITAGPSGRTRSTSATFRFRSSESRSSFRCRLDTRPWTSCRSPRVYRNLRVGSHTFRVAARDAAGNLDATAATRTWIVSRATRA